jgi:hypothetical protein
LIGSFKAFYVGILGFQKWFDVDAMEFLIEFRCEYFYIFWIGNSLGYFSMNWAFCLIFWSP